MQKQKEIKITITLILFCFSLFACTQEKPKTPKKPPAQQQAQPITTIKLTPENTEYCPQINRLTKQNLTWHGPGGWRNNDPSFSTKITSFIGAQWKGIRNGKIICIYRGDGDDFPITLQTNRFVAKPPGKEWRKGQELDSVEIYNCVSTDPSKCPFAKGLITYDDEAPDPFAPLKEQQ